MFGRVVRELPAVRVVVSLLKVSQWWWWQVLALERVGISAWLLSDAELLPLSSTLSEMVSESQERCVAQGGGAGQGSAAQQKVLWAENVESITRRREGGA